MKLYKDKDLTEEIQLLDLGIVPAGEKKRFTFYLFNDSNAYLSNLEFNIEHDEVEIVEAPNELTLRGSDEIIIEWSPSITLKEGLKTQLKISGTELWD